MRRVTTRPRAWPRRAPSCRSPRSPSSPPHDQGIGLTMLDQRATSIRVATDVGGTFTDLVYFATDPATGRQVVRTAKVDTTPPDYEKGVLDVLAKSGIDA